MTKIYYNETPIKNNTPTEISNAIKKIDDSKSNIRTLEIPGDFSYRSYLINLPNDLQNIIVSLRLINNWVDKSVDAFNNASLDINDLISSYSCNDIKKDNEHSNKLY